MRTKRQKRRQEKFEQHVHKGREAGDCPSCKSRDTLAVNTHENLAYCFGCGWHGTIPLRLVRENEA